MACRCCKIFSASRNSSRAVAYSLARLPLFSTALTSGATEPAVVGGVLVDGVEGVKDSVQVDEGVGVGRRTCSGSTDFAAKCESD